MAGLRCSQCEDFTCEEEIDDRSWCLDCQLREEEQAQTYLEEMEEHRTHPY